MGIRKLLRIREHKYVIKKWRLCHYREEPLTRVVGLECEKCRKRKVVYGLSRDIAWEDGHKGAFDSNLWDSRWDT